MIYHTHKDAGTYHFVTFIQMLKTKTLMKKNNDDEEKIINFVI